MKILPFACLSTWLFAFFITAVYANTEKVIFIAPESTILPDATPSLDNLYLDHLSADQSLLSLALPVAFPTEDYPHGLESWYLLRHLNKGQRYEVRLCWPAVQPTELWLDVFNVTHVFHTPELIQGLAAFSEQKIKDQLVQPSPEIQRPAGSEESVLFLRVNAAADFFTTNESLMLHPPPVDSELILDPFLGNIFPQSLVPTAAYILVLAVASWFISGTIWRYLRSISRPEAKKHSE